ncbi:ABC transporter ATP-binding protein [Actinoplanes utahensis]|uniref:ABC transporter ATP-binding protein n=1 Tax=Actinoplanes utahensis TaxID=1869 RepID=UPI0006904858|nr:ATP-binding cassette domain-containing protein [Actinoplanes utahensis]GIF32198.1 multidrug ABC transporter permease [Actinoplanes utahensis]
MGWLDTVGGLAYRMVRAMAGVAPKPAPASRTLRERLALLALFRLAGPGYATVLIVAHTVAAVSPAALALATGGLVATMTGTGGVTLSAGAGRMLLVFAALLLAEQAAEMTREITDRLAADEIDRRVRRRVRRLAAAPPGIEHLESPGFADDALRASDNGSGGWGTRSAGTAATGQIRLLFRWGCALVSAGLLAAYFPVLAAGLVLGSLLMRAIVRQQWIGVVEVWDDLVPEERRGGYWADLAAGPAAAKEVRLFGLGGWVIEQRRISERVRLLATGTAGRAMLRRQGYVLTPTFLLAASALLVPGLAAARGQITVAALATCLGAAWGVFRVAGVGLEAFDIEYGAGAVRALDRLERRHLPRSAVTAGGGRAAGSGPPLIRFEGVAFGYPGADRPTLRGLNLDIRPGEVIGVVGVNGAGKTTMIKLLAGLYRPDTGRITVDGADLADHDVHAWRRRITVVFQDFIRYPLSIRDNIALGAADHPPLPAGTVAGLAGDIGRDDLEVPLSRGRTGGTDLSGGQWQRLAFARALYAVRCGRDVVVLDEPTAHLDVRAESEFFDRMVAEVRGATVLLISHRLSTIRNADRIVLIDGGRIAATGTHDELLAAGGAYAGLFRLQAARFAEAGGGAER